MRWTPLFSFCFCFLLFNILYHNFSYVFKNCWVSVKGYVREKSSITSPPILLKVCHGELGVAVTCGVGELGVAVVKGGWRYGSWGIVSGGHRCQHLWALGNWEWLSPVSTPVCSGELGVADVRFILFRFQLLFH